MMIFKCQSSVQRSFIEGTDEYYKLQALVPNMFGIIKFENTED